jgi:hypothetical protein
MHVASDIRDADAMMATFSRHAGAITAVIHAAAQPSHDWRSGAHWRPPASSSSMKMAEARKCAYASAGDQKLPEVRLTLSARLTD